MGLSPSFRITQGAILSSKDPPFRAWAGEETFTRLNMDRRATALLHPPNKVSVRIRTAPKQCSGIVFSAAGKL
jgi:hypothetical protein